MHTIVGSTRAAGLALAAAALLVACGGGSGVAPLTVVNSGNASHTPFPGTTGFGSAPTPVAPPTSIANPTAAPTATSISGLPSPSPAPTSIATF